MNWQLVPQFAATGLLNGGPIALVALGIVLIFKASYLFNFAQGQLLLLGTLLTWWLSELGWPLWAAILGAVLAAALLGVAIERVALRPMTNQPLLSIVLMTLALSQVLQGVALLFFGNQAKSFPRIFEAENPYKLTTPFTNKAGTNIVVILQQNLVWSSLVALAAVVIIGAFFRFTRTGLAMRAASEDHELAQSIGLSIKGIFALSWALASVVATLGGILLATASGLDLSLAFVVLTAFPVVLLGGLDSIPGTIAGGLLIGLGQGLVKASTVPIVKNSSEILPYLILLVVLLIRPTGIFGQRRVERV
ncbi:MAG TPA: branched-chain amino acid ABC transporter permease [Herpetosiphonaceae bacterium]|nr:branched-chain amino acid ABC transporter permease [Herpetosiphonaceae bacterium]